LRLLNSAAPRGLRGSMIYLSDGLNRSVSQHWVHVKPFPC
jgi:hypothetical protein